MAQVLQRVLTHVPGLRGLDDLPPGAWGWWRTGGWAGNPEHPAPVILCGRCGGALLLDHQHVIAADGHAWSWGPYWRSPHTRCPQPACGAVMGIRLLDWDVTALSVVEYLEYLSAVDWKRAVPQ